MSHLREIGLLGDSYLFGSEYMVEGKQSFCLGHTEIELKMPSRPPSADVK